MLEEHHELIIKLMAEKINDLQRKYDYERKYTDCYRGWCQKLEDKIKELKPKRGRPVKKRGRGRPKGSRNV